MDNINDADLMQAFKDLADGEVRAAALEQHLTDLESRIEHLLATVEQGRDSVTDKPQREPGQKSGKKDMNGAQDHSNQSQ